MKIVILLVFIVVCGLLAVAQADHEAKLTDEDKAKIKQNIVDCMESEHASKETIHELREGKFENPGPNAKCFLKCYIEKFGVFANGEPQAEVILEKLPAIISEDKVKIVMDSCNHLRGTDHCDTAFKLHECYAKHNAVIL